MKPPEPKQSKPATGPRAKRPKSKSSSKLLGEKILAGLKAAGSDPVQVADLAATLHLGPRYLGAWLASASRRIPGLQKLGTHQYRFAEEPPERRLARKAKSKRPATAKAVREKQLRPSASLTELAPCKRSGELTAEILEGLKAAGKAGIKNSELAVRLGLHHKQTANWFYYTAKNLKCVERIAPGTYRLNGHPAIPTKPTAAGREDVRPAVRRCRGGLTAAILAELKAAGEAGITITALAAKVGTSFRNTAVWFQNAGSRIHGVERVGHGTYRYNPGCYRPGSAPKTIRGHLTTKVTTKVLPALKGAGAAGIRIKDLAAALGMSRGSLAQWLTKAGQRMPEIERIGLGTYRYNPGNYPPVPPPGPFRSPIQMKMVTELEAAGPAGLRVRDLAAALGMSRGNLSHWLKTAGRRKSEIEHIAYGVYRFNPGCNPPAPTTGPFRSPIQMKVVTALEAAGAAGLRVKDLAATLGMSRRNLGQWLQTAGKRTPEIERLARGVYRLRPAA